MWRRFFNRLGYRVELSGPTTEQMREIGTRITGAEFCFPAKVALGHVADLASQKGVDFVFVPHMVSEEQNPHTNASKFCPYVQAMPSYARTALELNGISVAGLLSPVIDLRLPENQLLDFLTKALSKPLRVNRKTLRLAWRDGLQTQREFEQRCQEEGRAEGKKGASQGKESCCQAKEGCRKEKKDCCKA